MKKLPLLILASTTLSGCDMPPLSYSSDDWRHVITATGNDCPDISGTYTIMDEPGYRMLSGHYEEKPKQWATMSIAGNPQQELQITLYEAKTGINNSEAIKRVRSKNYECTEGLLQTDWPHGAESLTGTKEQISQSDQVEKSLSFGKNKMGDLVVRSNTRTWKGISVWCGDGCTYLPIPFTASTRHQYSRWPNTSIPVVKVSANTLALDKLTPEGKVTAVLNSFLPTQVKLVRLTSTGDNQWKANFQGSANGLIALHEELQTTGDIQLIDVQSNISSSMKELVTEFHISPSQKEIAAQQTEEEARLELVTEHETRAKALIKKLIPSLPKGMIISASRSDETGFLVELRHPDEDAFYQLLVKAIASGEFATADIKTRKPMDAEGNQVADVLFKPR